MKYKDIVDNIKAKNFENMYILYGKEHYLIDNTIKFFRESLDQSMLDFNLDILDGKEVMIEQLLSSIETLPFMDERKIVVVKDCELLLKGKKKNFSDKNEKAFVEHLENIPDTTVLVFVVYGDIDQNKSLVKKVKEKGLVFNCEKISDADLVKWIRKKFSENNVMIENSQIFYFIESTGYKEKNSELTLSDLENEIKKISSFVSSDTPVTNDIIDRLSQRKIENDIFKLMDYIGEKNSQSAIKMLNDMIMEGESILGIFSMLSRQFKTVIAVKYFLNEGLSNKKIAENMNISLFKVNKSVKISKNFTHTMIVDMLNYLLESDFKIKKGIMKDTLAIEILVSKYCQKEVS